MPFSEITKIGPPSPDQIEVCIFGPNYGECVLIHLGSANWIVIDSCIYEAEPVLVAYFRALGVDPAQAIKVVIATHWHDDHCKGLSQVLRLAPTAEVWIALALTNHEFLRFLTRMGENKTAVAGNKLSEFSNVIDEIANRERAGLVNYGLAAANTLIYRSDASFSGHGFACEVIALSPSQSDTFNFMRRIADTMPQIRKTKVCVPSPSPNDVSIVTRVSVGPIAILLGADLENSGTPTAGWEAIISRARQSGSSPPAASLYKIPHHGSENAHNPEIWNELLKPNPMAVLTPWRKAGRRLPTSNGIERH